MNNFFSFHFWFNSMPGALIPLWKNVLIMAIVVFLALAVFSFILRRNKKSFYFKFWGKAFNFSSTNVFFGLLLWFFNSELIIFLSARFWYLLWLVEVVVWLYFIFKYLNSLPEKRKQIQEERNFKKYIP